ncbi:MAG: glycosyl hydrolase family 18 protein [Clostridiales bacterium]|nr:glycosyl hydrolase family 18 protein [Clostridiales bacterium]
MGRSRQKKNSRSASAVFAVLICAFFVILAVGLGPGLAKMLLPSGERKDLNEWFEVGKEEVRIYLNEEPEDEFLGTRQDGGVYLPFEYVRETLNSRFFLSRQDEMLSYTLPDGTDDIRLGDSCEGRTALIETNGEYLVSLDVVEKYTDITAETFCSEETAAGRLYLNTGGSVISEAELVKKASVRTRRDRRAPILTTASKGETVIVSDSEEDWSRVRTADGIIGFIRSDCIGETFSRTINTGLEAPDYGRTETHEKIVMGWHGVYNKQGNASLDRILGTSGGHINVISPTWIQIAGAKGEIENFSDREYVEKAHAAGIDVWAGVDNFNQPGGVSEFRTGEFFESAENRRGFIDVLIESAENFGYDGLNLDFEGIPSSAGESYTQFIRELSVKCRSRGLVLSVDNYVPYGFNDFYNIDEQGIFADYVVVMLYDENTSEAGPVASLSYTEYGISKTLEEVPAERVIAAFPLYTRLWTEKDGKLSSETMSISKAVKYAEEQEIGLSWDEESGQLYGEKRDGVSVRRLWTENGASLKLKMQVAEENQTGGIAVWRLGYDTEEVWEVLGWKHD